jgi:hypothetical protein
MRLTPLAGGGELVPRWAVSEAFPSCVRSSVTEIYRCHDCSCHEILRMGAPGQVSALAAGPMPPPPEEISARHAAAQLWPRLTAVAGEPSRPAAVCGPASTALRARAAVCDWDHLHCLCTPVALN